MDNFVLLSEGFSLSLPRQIVIIKSNNQNMMKNLFLTFALLGSSAMLSAQTTIKIPKSISLSRNLCTIKDGLI